MASIRRDPRYEAADERIRAAFLALFESAPIEDITVSQVIRAAGVNRSTFYAHYADKHALLAAVEHGFLEQMGALFRQSPTLELLLGEGSDEAAWQAYFGRLVDFLSANRQLFAGLAGRESSSFMVDFSGMLSQAIEESGAVSKLGIPVNYESALLAWATAGLVVEWARGGFAENREEVVRILVRVATGIQGALIG